MKLKKWIKTNEPTILAAFGVVTFVAAMVMTAKQTPKAEAKVVEKENELNRPLTKWEHVKVVTPVYAGPAVMAGAASAVIFTGNRIHLKREATAVSMVVTANQTIRNLKDHMVAVAGQDIHDAVMNSVAKDVAEKSDISEPAPQTGALKEEWCIDVVTGEEWICTLDEIMDAKNEINSLINEGEYPDLNDFRYLTRRKQETEAGKMLGWGEHTGKLRVTVSEGRTRDGILANVIFYEVGLAM